MNPGWFITPRLKPYYAIVRLPFPKQKSRINICMHPRASTRMFLWWNRNTPKLDPGSYFTIIVQKRQTHCQLVLTEMFPPQ